MPHTKYLIVGGGMTGDSAVKGIRSRDSSGAITVIAAESQPPYNRPPLSKGLWKGDPVESIWRDSAKTGAELILGRKAVQLNAKQKQVTDDRGTVYTFDKLLIATGGTVNRLPFGGDDVIYYRTLDDYQHLRKLASNAEPLAVIGGGFIGWEIAAALAMNGGKPIVLFPQSGLGSRIFPSDLAAFLNDFYREKGVVLNPGETAAGIERSGANIVVTSRSGKSMKVGGVVAGIGIRPNVELAQSAGLKITNGISVDEQLQTSAPDIYAAGDVAEFFNPALNKRIRVEHEDAANSMGEAAGANMAGAAAPYHHLPFFYSDLFDLGFEAVGDLDSRLETFADWKEPFREGVVYYLNQGRVRGVLLWNTWGQVDHARALITETARFKPSELTGRLPIS